MKMLLLILCSFAEITGVLFGQSLPRPGDSRYFRTISVEQGLSQSTVFAIEQDTMGFIWMGTQDGLNKYDGYSFTVYRPDKNNKNSLQSNYIRSLLTDEQGMLWVGGNEGISSYDYKTGLFKNYALPVKPGEWYISSITTDKEHRIWGASNTGEIFYLDQTAGRFLLFNYTIPGKTITSIQQLKFINNELYVATGKGLCKMDVHSKKGKMLYAPALDLRINCLLLQNNYLWLGTEEDGLFRLHLDDNKLDNYLHQPLQTGSLIDNNIRSIEIDEAGDIWVGTFNGLSIYNKRTATFDNFTHHPTGFFSLSQNSVRAIFRDSQNGMWVGTFYGGVNYYHKDDIRFNILGQNAGRVLLNDQTVNFITEDAAHNIWIGTNNNGINVWNRERNSIAYFTHSESGNRSISSNTIKAIAFDKEGNALVGTHNAGMNIIQKNGTINKYMHDAGNSNSISSNMVHALLKDHNNRLWVGTRAGLDRFDKEKQVFIHYSNEHSGPDSITFLLQDQKQRIWIGTTNGVSCFFPEKNLFEVYPGNKLSNELVTSIAEDQLGRIWVGTRDGLNLFNERQKQFTAFQRFGDTLQGLIYSVQPDNSSGIWISTNKGLIKLHNQLRHLQIFNSSNGVGNIQSGFPAACKTSDHVLLFGGLNGIVYFNPHELTARPFRLNVTFTGLTVLGNSITPGNSKGILNGYLNDTRSIHLTYEQQQFTLFFSALNYVAPGTIKYRYMLKGFDKAWQMAENAPKAAFTNVPPGNYRFLVQAIGPSGEESPVNELKIIVSPPWWRANWFYLALALALVVAGYIIYRVIRERVQAKNILKNERIEREKAEALNQLKMDFFTNISHEFRTPLTLMMAPLEEMLTRQLPEKRVQRYHRRMLANTKHLYQLVGQLMEFRKTEAGVRKLDLQENNIIHCFEEIYASFLELSRQKNIGYYFRSTEKAFTCRFDKDVIEKICYNLLSNAFKYTQAGDTVEMELLFRNDQMTLTVRDTGTGIALPNPERVFEKFYQVSKSDTHSGSGIGLAFTKSLVDLYGGSITVESELGKGAVFTVVLPLGARHSEITNNIPGSHFDLVLDNRDDAGNDWVKETDIAASANDSTIEEKQRLLIVDDNQQIVDYLSDFFEQYFFVSTAFNGKEALQVMEKVNVDIVISDVAMPELDGIQLCKRIKQNILTSHIPVILLTAKTETPQQLKGLEAGADDYISKPFSISILNIKVQNITRSRKRLKEYYSSATSIAPEHIALNPLDEAFLRDAISVVQENLDNPQFSVSIFSHKVGMSRSNLYNKLKAITGESATDFIKRIKLEKSVELLDSKLYSVTEIAYLSGFSSLSYFSTSFKQRYGCMPTEYLANKNSG